jgi:hypothetical protein
MATRLQIVTDVINETGHHELVLDALNGDYTDAGINKYVNDGQRWLDRRFEHKKDRMWLYKPLAIGQSVVSFTKARWVEQVWIAYSGGTRTMLDKVDRDYLRTHYSGIPLSGIANATPIMWTVPVTNLAPEQVAETNGTLTALGLTDLDFLQYGDTWLTETIAILPPPDRAYTVEVMARWRYNELTTDATVSFWSMSEPDVLRAATKMQMEIHLHRNDSGAKTYENYCLGEIKRLEHELASEQAAGPPERFRMFGRPPVRQDES